LGLLSAESRRVRFKSDEVEANSEQILGAMGKIASHIGNPGKFSKACKLALQLLQAGSVKSDTADAFFEILRASMTLPSQAVDSKLCMDYHSLFSAVMDKLEVPQFLHHWTVSYLLKFGAPVYFRLLVELK
jgi:hypothetical protein